MYLTTPSMPKICTGLHHRRRLARLMTFQVSSLGYQRPKPRPRAAIGTGMANNRVIREVQLIFNFC